MGKHSDERTAETPAPQSETSPGTTETPPEQKFDDALAWASKVAGAAGADSDSTELLGTSAAVAVGSLFESGTLALSQAMFASVGNMQQSAILSQASTAANVRKMLAADTSDKTSDMIQLIESLATILRPPTTDINIQD